MFLIADVRRAIWSDEVIAFTAEKAHSQSRGFERSADLCQIRLAFALGGTAIRIGFTEMRAVASPHPIEALRLAGEQIGIDVGEAVIHDVAGRARLLDRAIRVIIRVLVSGAASTGQGKPECARQNGGGDPRRGCHLPRIHQPSWR